jgi:hypothetical protein
MAAPFLAQGVYKAVIFSVNSAVAKMLKNGDEPLSLAKKAICGSVAGAANSVVVTPVELVRNRLQVNVQTKRVHNRRASVLVSYCSLS